jgi:hypothetical protein
MVSRKRTSPLKSNISGKIFSGYSGFDKTIFQNIPRQNIHPTHLAPTGKMESH